MSLIRSILTVSFFTLLSRFLGLFRDILIASTLGASRLSDAFFLAFKIPNLFRRFFAEGAFSASFIPMFSQKWHQQGRQKALEFTGEILVFFLVILLIFTTFFMSFTWLFVLMIAPGFSQDPQTLEWSIFLTRLTFPYLTCMFVVSILSGVLQSQKHFTQAAIQPIFLNLCLIFAILICDESFISAPTSLALGVLVAGFIQCFWIIFHARRFHVLPHLHWPQIRKNVYPFMKRMIPGAVGASVYQINLLVDTLFASFLAHQSLSYLYYADRLSQLPLALIGTAIGTVLLPSLSHCIEKNDLKGAQEHQKNALRFGFLLSFPATVGLFLLAAPIIECLFQRGAFTHEMTQNTAFALQMFAIGLPAHVMTKILLPIFFSHKDTSTPVRIAIICLCSNIIFNLVLIGFLGHAAIALSTSISSWINAFLLAFILWKKNLFHPCFSLLNHMFRILIVTIIMGFGIYYFNDDFLSHLPLWLGLITMICLSIISFFLLSMGIKIITLKDLKALRFPPH